MIQEKLEERKKRWERDMERQQAEQSQLVAEQEKAIKQVLNTQAGLAEEYVFKTEMWTYPFLCRAKENTANQADTENPLYTWK